MAIPWATNLIFTQISCLKIVFNLAVFCLATYLATFQKIGQFFPKSSGHPVALQQQFRKRQK
jgi:hypothetical protein